MRKNKNNYKDIAKKTCLITASILLVILMIGGIGYAAMVGYVNWQRHKFNGAVLASTVESNIVTTEAKHRFYLTSPDKSAIFLMNITTNLNESWLLGPFKMEYKVKKILEDPREQKFVDVVYSVPEDWLIKNATDFDVKAEFKTKIQKTTRRDPTFFRGKDYPSTIPFDEIEITTDFVAVYIDTNETEFNFIVAVRENQDRFNIREVELIVPNEYNIRKD